MLDSLLFKVVEVEKSHMCNNSMTLVLEREGNIVGKGKNAAKQYFLLFLPCFQHVSLLGVRKTWVCVIKKADPHCIRIAVYLE